MRKNLRIFFSLLILSSGLLFLPVPVQADGCTVIDSSLDTYGASLPNLPHYCTVGPIVRRVLNIAFTLIGSVSLLFIIIGGYQIMMGSATPFGEKKEQSYLTGKKTITYAIMGLVVVILAVTIVNIIINLVLYGKTF